MARNFITAVQEMRQDMGRFDVAAVIQRYGRAGRWHMMVVYAATLEHFTFDTLAEAKALYMERAAEADEARWTIESEAAVERAAERYWEEGTSQQQMQYQAELDAEAAALGWDPMVVGAFGPDYN